MSKVIIGIHGLANKPDKQILSKWWEEAIHEGLISKEINCKTPKFELVYWADLIYSKPLDLNITDKKSPYYLEDPYSVSINTNIKQEDYSTRIKILDYFNSKTESILMNKDLTAKYPLVSEALVHLFFKDLESYYSNIKQEDNSLLRHSIRERLSVVLEKHKHDEILLVAHSMGSIIAYDVLSLISKDINIDTFITIGSPLGSPIVKSKYIKDSKYYGHKIKKLKTPNNIKRYWLNFADIEDKVAVNYKLSDDYSENSNNIKVSDFLVYNNFFSNNERNAHKSYGYLRCPELANAIFSFAQQKNRNLVVEIINYFKKNLSKIKRKKEKIKTGYASINKYIYRKEKN